MEKKIIDEGEDNTLNQILAKIDEIPKPDKDKKKKKDEK